MKIIIQNFWVHGMWPQPWYCIYHNMFCYYYVTVLHFMAAIVYSKSLVLVLVIILCLLLTVTRHVTRYMHIQVLCDCCNGIPHTVCKIFRQSNIYRALRKMKSQNSSPTGHSQNIHPANICAHTVCIASVVLYMCNI